MSSPRRFTSSRAPVSSSNPSWRTPSSTRKSRAPTSISLVFAQPEPGLPLRSAVDNLPGVGIDDAASFMSEMSRKRERGLSLSQESDSGPQRDTEDMANKRSKSESVIPSELLSSSPTHIDVNLPEQESCKSINEVHQSTHTTTPPNSAPILEHARSESSIQLPAPAAPSTWFGSFSRAKGGNSAKRGGELQSHDTSQPRRNQSPALKQSVPSVQVQPATPKRAQSKQDSVAFPIASLPQAISTPSATESQAVPLYPGSSPKPHSTGAHSATVAAHVSVNSLSSLDEEVPRLRLSTSPEGSSVPGIVENDDMRTGGRKQSISSLNPSASRFSLRIPMLGRPKIPLDQAVAAAALEGSRGKGLNNGTDGNKERPVQSAVDSTATVSTSPIKSEDKTTNVIADQQSLSETPRDESVSAPPSTEVTNEGREISSTTEHVSKPEQQVAAGSSWWDYVGWGASTQPGTVVDPQPATDSSSPDTPLASAQPISPTSNCEPFPPHVEQVSNAQTSSVPSSTTRSEIQDAQQSRQPDASEDRAASLFSAETAKSQGSTWYNPWLWYAASPVSVSNDPTGISGEMDTSTSTPAPSSMTPTSELTESEKVKEEALARHEPPTAPEPETHTSMSSSGGSANPIEASISTNRSGWASFFMSRALLVKRVAGEDVARDENGMEVMDIDDDAPSEGGDTAVSCNSVVPSSQQRSTSPVPSPSSGPSMPIGPSREPKKSNGPPAAPMTNSKSIKRETINVARPPSPTPSKQSAAPPSVSAPNLVLPTWTDTFHSLPRSSVPPVPNVGRSKVAKTLSFVGGVLFSKDEQGRTKSKGKEREPQQDAEFLEFGKELPKALDIVGEQLDPYMMNGGCRVVVIGVAGWSPGAVTRTISGGLPSSSSKFVNMTCQALEKFQDAHGFKFKKITKIPLEGDGMISRKVDRVHQQLLDNDDWMENLHAADVIFVASHSQGSIVATHLLDRLLRDGHILTSWNVDILTHASASLVTGGVSAMPSTKAQRICCLDLCGIHLGPLRYLKTSSLLQPYIQYFENAAARELFDFQDTESQSSKNYTRSLKNVLDHGSKMVFVASLNDQVVPVYSGLFTAASHPRILRALYIDGDAYHSSDFLSNLLVLLIRIMNAGLSDSGLLAHLSEATAGTLSGIGHSTAYEEPATYDLAVDYFFLCNDGTSSRMDLVVEPFNAVNEQNDYEIPWSLRDMIADPRVARLFAQEFAQLRDAFDDWQPKTTILKDIKRKLQPIQRLSSISGLGSASKL